MPNQCNRGSGGGGPGCCWSETYWTAHTYHTHLRAEVCADLQQAVGQHVAHLRLTSERLQPVLVHQGQRPQSIVSLRTRTQLSNKLDPGSALCMISMA